LIAGSMSKYINPPSVLQLQSDRRDNEWVLADIPQTATRDHDFFDLLIQNANLPSSYRYAITDSGTLVIRSDYPQAAFSDDDDSEYTGEFGVLDSTDSASAARRSDQDADPLHLAKAACSCRSGRWTCVERSDGSIAVDLELRTGAASVSIDASADGLELCVDLLTIDSDDRTNPKVCESLGLFLLRVSGAVHMIRPQATCNGDQVSVQLLIFIPSKAVHRRLLHALASLSVAASTCRTECRMLLDPSLADIFLMTDQ